MQNQKIKNPFNHLLQPGHRGCAGCGELLAARTVIDAMGPDTIIANATGCLEVTTSPYPESSWQVPWIHSLFENASAIGTGISAALKAKGDTKTKVLVQGGDGSTFDIGYGLISGMWERGDDILYVCYDNEAYMNTGVQASGATPYGADTTTTPYGTSAEAGFGNNLPKKNMPVLAMAQGVKYVAQTTIGYPLDVVAKVKKALTFKGPKYIQILSPCVPGWGYDSKMTIKLAQLAHKTGLYPVYEAENGKITKIMPFPAVRPKVEEYLMLQKRFKHLFKDKQDLQKIAEIQKIADERVASFTQKI
jgi:pyruvate ferredoxin oxidoreductase beta subunit